MQEQGESRTEQQDTGRKRFYTPTERQAMQEHHILKLQVSCATARGKLGFKNTLPDEITISALQVYERQLNRRIKSRTRRGLL